MPIIAELAMIMGHDVANKNPYNTKKAQPIELMTLNLVTFFIMKETSSIAIAR